MARASAAGQVAAEVGRRVEVVERLGDAQVGVGVEVGRELVALVAQVGLDLEVDVEVEARRAAAQHAAELLRHRLARDVGDVADHARDAQAAHRHHALLVVVAAVEIRVGHDRLARHLVEGDVLRRELGRRGDDDRVAHALGVGERPLQRLHRAERAADHRGEALDAEAVGEARLRLDPVLDRDHREVRAPGLAGRRVDRRRAGRAEAAAEVVRADDEEAVACRAACRGRPGCPTSRRCSCRLRRSRPRGARHSARGRRARRSTARGVQLAVGLVGDVVGGQRRRRCAA